MEPARLRTSSFNDREDVQLNVRFSVDDIRPSFDYAQRRRQSADITRTGKLNARPSFDVEVKARMSLDPELLARGTTSSKGTRLPLSACTIVLHGQVDPNVARAATAAGIFPGVRFFGKRTE